VRNEIIRDTTGQNKLQNTVRKRRLCRFMVWNFRHAHTNGRLQKSKTSTALDSWWKEEAKSTTHHLERYWIHGQMSALRQWTARRTTKSGSIGLPDVASHRKDYNHTVQCVCIR